MNQPGHNKKEPVSAFVVTGIDLFRLNPKDISDRNGFIRILMNPPGAAREANKKEKIEIVETLKNVHLQPVVDPDGYTYYVGTVKEVDILLNMKSERYKSLEIENKMLRLEVEAQRYSLVEIDKILNNYWEDGNINPWKLFFKTLSGKFIETIADCRKWVARGILNA